MAEEETAPRGVVNNRQLLFILKNKRTDLMERLTDEEKQRLRRLNAQLRTSANKQKSERAKESVKRLRKIAEAEVDPPETESPFTLSREIGRQPDPRTALGLLNPPLAIAGKILSGVTQAEKKRASIRPPGVDPEEARKRAITKFLGQRVDLDERAEGSFIGTPESRRELQQDIDRATSFADAFLRGKSPEVETVNEVLGNVFADIGESYAKTAIRPDLMIAEGRKFEAALNVADFVGGAGLAGRAIRATKTFNKVADTAKAASQALSTGKQVKAATAQQKKAAAALGKIAEDTAKAQAAGKPVTIAETTEKVGKVVEKADELTGVSTVQSYRDGAARLAQTADDYRALGETERAREVAAQAEKLSQAADELAAKAGKKIDPANAPEAKLPKAMKRDFPPDRPARNFEKAAVARKRVAESTAKGPRGVRAFSEAEEEAQRAFAQATGLLGNEAGQANKALIATLAASPAGAFIGAQIAQETDGNVYVGALAGALGTMFLGTPTARRITAGTGKVDFGAEIFRGLEKILPDRLISPEDRLRFVRRASLGLMGSEGLGGRIALQTKKGFNPLRTAKKVLLEQGKKLSPEHAEALARIHQKEFGVLRRMKDANRALSKADPAELEIVKDYLEGKASIKAIPTKLRESALDYKHGWQELMLTLNEIGLEGAETAHIVTELGKYNPKLYAMMQNRDEYERVMRYLGEMGGDRALTPKLFKELQSKDIPGDVRQALNKLEEDFKLGSPTAIANFEDFSHKMTTRRWARHVAAHSDLSKTADEVAEGVAAGEIRTTPRTGPSGRLEIETDKERFIQLPDGPAYGELAGKYVTEEIADDFMGLVQSPGALKQAMDSALSTFKRAKVPWNPATQIRNVVGAIVMTNVAGEVPLYRLDVWKGAITELRQKGKLFKEARDAGVFGRTFLDNELTGDMTKIFSKPGGNALTKTLDFMAKGGDKVIKGTKKAEDIFNNVEEWNKLVLFKWARQSKGMNVADAAEFALRNGFDYHSVPQWVKWNKKSIFGNPFVTFSYKALPRTLEAAIALQNPKKMLGFWKYPMIMAGANELMAHSSGSLDEQDLDSSFMGSLKRTALNGIGMGIGKKGWAGDHIYQRFMPDYFGANMTMLPFKDEHGLDFYFDATYYLPWGDFGSLGEGPLGKNLAASGLPGFPGFLEPSHPVLQTITANITNRNTLTGQKIAVSTNPIANFSERAVYAGGIFAPSWFPIIGRGFRRVERSIGSAPGKEKPLQALLSVAAGVSAKKLDIKTEANKGLGRLRGELREINERRSKLENTGGPQRAFDAIEKERSDKEQEIEAHEKDMENLPDNKALARAVEKFVEAQKKKTEKAKKGK